MGALVRNVFDSSISSIIKWICEREIAFARSCFAIFISRDKPLIKLLLFICNFAINKIHPPSGGAWRRRGRSRYRVRVRTIVIWIDDGDETAAANDQESRSSITMATMSAMKKWEGSEVNEGNNEKRYRITSAQQCAHSPSTFTLFEFFFSPPSSYLRAQHQTNYIRNDGAESSSARKRRRRR